MVIESQLPVIWDTTKTKRYQQETPTYLQFSEKCKIYIFLDWHHMWMIPNKNELEFNLDDSNSEWD